MKQISRIPLIIDTDPGHDDALAIMLASMYPGIDIRAVTTVAGNGAISDVTNNARFILDFVGNSAPIYSGADRPLRRKLIRAVVHGENALAGVDVTKVEPLTKDAPYKIIKIVRDNPGDITILALGPQTNIARAFLLDPTLPRLVRRIVMMAGAVEVPGNKNRVAEFNVFVDPEAAQIVFDAPVKKVMIPLDVCNTVAIRFSDFNRLKKSACYSLISSMMKEYIQGIKENEKTDGALMYDVLAAYYLVKPEAFRIKPMDVRVETRGRYTRGMTVADRRIWGEQEANIDVAFSIYKRQFVDDFFSLLQKGTYAGRK